jgi:hypothetical protein
MRRDIFNMKWAPISANSLMHHSYEFLRALRILSEKDIQGPVLVMGLIAAHTLELAFKAYLLARGMTEEDFTRPGGIGHDIERALSECETRGLNLSGERAWINVLNIQHNYPFLYRYGRQGWGQSIPGNRASLTENVERVLFEVASSIQGLNQEAPEILGSSPNEGEDTF